jgi:hypothetical protein
MQDSEQKKPSSCFEIFILVIFAIAIYLGALWFLYFPIASYMPVWFFGPLGLFMILGFDVFWIVRNRTPKHSMSKTGIIPRIPSIFVFSLSASILTCWLLLNIMRMFRW